MLKRRLRLPRSGFAALRMGRRLESPHFSLVFLADAPSGGAAAIVSKKVAPSSAARHLLKRRMLAVIGPFASRERALVAYAKAGSRTLSFSELSQELSALLAGTLGKPRRAP